MNFKMFLWAGNEVNGDVKKVFIEEIEKRGIDVNTKEPNEADKVALRIHQTVSDVDRFEQNIKSLMKNVPYLYLIAPSEAMENLKHHPRIQCFDTSFIQDPTIAANVLLDYAYHGRPI